MHRRGGCCQAIIVHVSAAALSCVWLFLLDVCLLLHAVSTGAICASNMVWLRRLPRRALLWLHRHVDE